MKIIKPGKDLKSVQFTCAHCGCEFECGETEYYTDQSFTNLSYPQSWTMVASCPACHKICKAYKRESTQNINLKTSCDICPKNC